MKRKLIRQGIGGTTLYIPKKWIDSKGLHPGDEVDIEERDGELVITKASRKAWKKTSLKLRKDDVRLVRSLLGSLYRRGYDEISIAYDDECIYKAVQQNVANLMGFEITDQEPKSCTVKSIMEHEELDIDKKLLKMCQIVRTILEITRKDFEKGGMGNLDTVRDIADNQRKFREYCHRAVVKNRLYGDKGYGYIGLMRTLEKLTHHYYHLYEQLSACGRPRKEFVVLLRRFEDFFDLFRASIFRIDVNSFQELRDRGRSLADSAVRMLDDRKFASYPIVRVLYCNVFIRHALSNLVFLNS
ncbi:hypothetical protein JW968_02150 [Candidatus Woesearchaeota archaeon]|nr:hypothetical protein [Candidatus Woesearchaeota archaeon]